MYVVSYDISSDRIRNKVAKELKNYGKRVQYSVFECNITKKRYGEMYTRLCKLTVKMDVGNIKIYSICENCIEKISVIGVPDISSKYDDEEVIII